MTALSRALLMLSGFLIVLTDGALLVAIVSGDLSSTVLGYIALSGGISLCTAFLGVGMGVWREDL